MKAAGWRNSRRREQVLLLKARLHNLHARRIGGANEVEGFFGRAGQPSGELVSLDEQHRTSFVVDGLGQGVGKRCQKGEDFEVCIGPVFLDGPFPLAVNAGESKERSLLCWL